MISGSGIAYEMEQEKIVAPDFVVEACLAGIADWPQMYGGAIIHGGRLAIDQLLDGTITFTELHQGQLDQAQREVMYEAATAAHKRYVIPVEPTRVSVSIEDFFIRGLVMPCMMPEMYKRSQRGIIDAIASAVLCGATDPAEVVPYLDSELAYEQYDCEQLLYNPFRKEEAQCLQALWQAADTMLAEKPARDVSKRLRLMMRYVPEHSSVYQRLHRGLAVHAARQIVHGLVAEAIEPLRARTLAVYGETGGADLMLHFPTQMAYEGREPGPPPTLRTYVQQNAGLM